MIAMLQLLAIVAKQSMSKINTLMVCYAAGSLVIRAAVIQARCKFCPSFSLTMGWPKTATFFSKDLST